MFLGGSNVLEGLLGWERAFLGPGEGFWEQSARRVALLVESLCFLSALNRRFNLFLLGGGSFCCYRFFGFNICLYSWGLCLPQIVVGGNNKTFGGCYEGFA